MEKSKCVPVFFGNTHEFEEWKKNAPKYAAVLLETFPDSPFCSARLPGPKDEREILAYKICADKKCCCKNRPCAWVLVKRE